MAGRRTPEEIQRILNQPSPLALTGPIRAPFGVRRFPLTTKGTINGYALTLKPAPIKWSDVVRIDEAQQDGLTLPVFTPVSRRFHTGSTLVSRRPHAGFAAKLTLRNTWVSLPPRGSARPA